jgi:hypothetical protein
MNHHPFHGFEIPNPGMGAMPPPTKSSRVTRGLLALLEGGSNALRALSGDEAPAHVHPPFFDPNERLDLKIERYSFSLSPAENFTLGVPQMFEATLQPSTRIHAKRVITNAPCPNFVILDYIQVANVNVLIGTQEDAYTYSPDGQGVALDLPVLDPANRASISGSYTGLVVEPFAKQVLLERPEPPVPPDRRTFAEGFDGDNAFEVARGHYDTAFAEWQIDDRDFMRFTRGRKVYTHAPFSFQFIVTFQGAVV